MPKRIKQKQVIIACLKLKQSAIKVQKQHYKASQLLIQQVLRIFPQFANALYLYSICIRQNKKQGYQQIKNKAYQLNDQHYKYKNQKQIEIIECIISNLEQALNYLIDIQSSRRNQWTTLVDITLKKHDFNTSEIFLQFFQLLKIPIDQFSDQIWSNIGVKYFQLGKYKQSIQMHQIAIKLSPNDVMYYNNLATLNYALGNYTQSQQYITKTFQLQPNRNKSYYLQSFICCKTNRIKQSLDKIQHAVKKQPQQFIIKIKLVLILLIYYSDKIQQIKKYIKQILKLIQSGSGSKYYFSYKQAFLEYINFLSNNLDDCKQYQQKWRQYLLLFDNFLIFGLKDKLKINKKMAKLSKQISQIKRGSVPNQQNNIQQASQKIISEQSYLPQFQDV